MSSITGRQQLERIIRKRRHTLNMLACIVLLIFGIVIYAAGSLTAHIYLDYENMQYYLLRDLQLILYPLSAIITAGLAIMFMLYLRGFARVERKLLEHSQAPWQLMTRSIPHAHENEIPDWSLCVQNNMFQKLDLSRSVSIADWFREAAGAMDSNRIRLRVANSRRSINRMRIPNADLFGILAMTSLVMLIVYRPVGIALLLATIWPMLRSAFSESFEGHMRISLLLEEVALRLE